MQDLDSAIQVIDDLFDKKADCEEDALKLINELIWSLDNGKIASVDSNNGTWTVSAAVKKAILLYMQTSKCERQDGGWDKIPLKTTDWTDDDFRKHNFRMVPGAIVRYGTYIASGVILMPCFVNIGAYIDEKTMIDTHATVGSCARIGKRCHISDGVTIGGVLEPIQASPVIVEDDCFIGAGSRITEGVLVQKGSVIAAGTILTNSTPIIDRASGAELPKGIIPAYSVVVPGTRDIGNGLHLLCAIIVKKVDEKTRNKTSINELLRM